MVGVLTAPVWSGATAMAVAADSGTAQLRFVHAISGGPSVDLYADGSRLVSGASYMTVSPYLTMRPGAHLLELRPAGASPTAAPLAVLTVNLKNASSYTVGVAGRALQPSMLIFQDGFSAPPAGQAEVRAIHLSPVVPAVDIAVKNGPVLFTSLAFGNSTSYQAVPAGTYDLVLRATGSGQVLLEQTVAVKPGAVESLVGVGGVDMHIEIQALDDAVGAPASGGALAGEGGTAGGAQMTLLAGLFIPASLALALLWTFKRPELDA
jgi:hypothetical protein